MLIAQKMSRGALSLGGGGGWKVICVCFPAPEHPARASEEVCERTTRTCCDKSCFKLCAKSLC
jgi:hypothetical protein